MAVSASPIANLRQQFRDPVFGLSLVDLFATLLAAYMLSKYVLKQNMWEIFLILWVLGTLLHVACGVQTPVTKVLGFNQN